MWQWQGIKVAGAIAAAYLFGGWTAGMDVLFWFVVVDYVTGIMASGAEGGLHSRKGLVGISRKVFIFLMVAVAHKADTLLGGGTDFMMNATVIFYTANELLSIMENGGRLGMPLPLVLKDAIALLKGKGGSGQ